jgi:hypothetical protein
MGFRGDLGGCRAGLVSPAYFSTRLDLIVLNKRDSQHPQESKKLSFADGCDGKSDQGAA